MKLPDKREWLNLAPLPYYLLSLLAHPRSLTTYEWLFKWVIEEAKHPIRHKDSPLSEQQMALHRLADLVTGEVLTGVEN